MSNDVFDKTDKGREEIATRVHRLPLRMRTLLLLMDGKHGITEVLDKVSGIGITKEHVQELTEQGFITALPASPPVAIRTVPSASAPAEPPTASEEASSPADAQSRFQSVYRFYTETIRSTLGLRGYVLQLKVEKAASVDDFLTLREPYLDAVRKAKGNEVARSLRDRLDQLLGVADTAPPVATAGAHQTSPQ